MLTEVELTNFQAHRSRSLTFSPNVNVIVGPTNAGKSSVFRAIRWLVEHKPITGLQTFGEDHTEVTIASEVGRVTRFKHPSEGYGNKVADATFVACATKQPSEVQATLGLSEINLQGQHDPPFLLSLSPGQMAKELNRIVDLSIIDKANAMVASHATKTKAELTAMQSIADKQQAELDQIAWVPGVLAQYESLEVFMQELQHKRNRYTALLSKVGELAANKADDLKLVHLIEGMQSLCDQSREIFDKQTRLSMIFYVVTHWTQALSKITLLNAVGAGLAKLKRDGEEIAAKATKRRLLLQFVGKYQAVKIIDGPVDDLVQTCKRLAESRARHIKIDRILLSLHDLQTRDSSQSQEIQTLETKLKETKAICPTCKKPL